MASSLTATTVSILFQFSIFLGEKEVLRVQGTAHSCVDPLPSGSGGRTSCTPRITVSLLSTPKYIYSPLLPTQRIFYRKHLLRLFRFKCLHPLALSPAR